MQQYRSGHNGADSKSVWSNPRGFESHLLRQNQKCLRQWRGHFLILVRDSNPERVSGEKKTVRWTVFRREVRSGYAARTDDARHSRSGIVPPAAPRRSKLYIACSDFFTKVRAHSCRCSSFSNHNRYAGLRFDLCKRCLRNTRFGAKYLSCWVIT